MKKVKILLPIIIIVLSLGFVVFDSANNSIEDAINIESETGSTSPVKTVIGKSEDNDVIIYIYKTEDNRFGYATVKDSKSLFNRYSVCTIGNIDESLLYSGKEIIEKYDKQNLNFTYGILFDPNDEVYEYKGNSYTLTMYEGFGYNIGVFVSNEM